MEEPTLRLEETFLTPSQSFTGEADSPVALDLAAVFGQGTDLFISDDSENPAPQEETGSLPPVVSLETEATLPENPSPETQEEKSEPKTPSTSEKVKIRESVRVDSDRLDRLNNLVGELVTQENGAALQNQRLQIQINKLKQHFEKFHQFSNTLQQWMDESLQAEIKSQTAQHQSADSSKKIPQTLQKYSDWSVIHDFDSLQMDSYSQFYTTVQAALDEMTQMREQLGDINLITQASQRIQRKKQQTLKQVRNDLLWARMIPLDTILGRFPRMVRDLSSQFNKRVRFHVTGASTLVDKVVLERLYDPLVHIVRNAFDHGCESTEERVGQGKSPQARIELRAYHRGNQTYIEVRDDGQGIHPEKIRRSLVEKGLVPEVEAQDLSTQALYQYLFEPSFSTAQEVTELSGRGMGLNAVKQQVEALKGSIKIDSTLGEGTSFIIALPLTLTIAKLLVFSVDGRDMSIPVDSLQGIIAADKADITTVQGQFFYCDEGELIPLFPSSNFMHQYPLPRGSGENAIATKIQQKDKTSIILIANNDEVLALEVDYVLEEQELVIKPFGKAIAPPKYLYGCAMMGDGALVPVLDPNIILANWQDTQESGSRNNLYPAPPPTIHHAQNKFW
ncbi:MAG: chemotaxis protein CheA [Acaryochloridaceae cyanobacterium RL_2_7]|nr:chemotaxis protein CheA [Acaryochloridaceae cyanobacterium RL_2_7]